MLNNLIRIKKWKIFLLVGLFLVVLTGSRILWMISFQSTEQPHVVNGQLDLRNWDATEGCTITLDGQWEFYPHTWLMSNGNHKEPVRGNPEFIQVPGNWNASLQPGHNTPYGYGSYRLRILVNPENDLTYSIRIPSVRSSSALYVNGRLLAKSGHPGATEEEYVAWNVPYSASFTTNGSNIIEVVIQAANYKDPRNSGIVRSLKFGTEDAIARETQLSVSMQQMVAVVFLLHAVYALILFLVGNREKRLLYFSLLIVSAMLINLLGSEEKLLLYWLPIDYELGFKLVHLSMIVVAYCLLQCVVHELPTCWFKIFPWYVILCGAAVLWLLLPSQYIVTLQPLYVMIIGISILIAIVSILYTSMKNIEDNVLLLLSLVAFTNSLVWWGVLLITGIKIVYYPFDLIVSMTCFASVWFRRYFQVHFETKNLAAKLQRVDKLKDEFLANTSHELRNPLHGILNISQAVLEREQHSLNEKSVKDLETVLSVGRRMTLMLNDLLDVMSLKESNPKLKMRVLSIQTIATGALDMLHFMTEGKPIQLINHIPEEFPKVFADENRVIQIVFNLLHNAVKYTNEGEISIRGYVKDGRAHIAISDTGIGMDEETMRRVFEPYEQADPGKTMIEGGFGLGLSISKQLVELHGGTLQVSSVLGHGSEFTFTLQLADPAILQEETETKIHTSIAFTEAALAASVPPFDSISGQQPQILTDRPRILVVDDDPVNLKVLETVLSSEQFDIMTVTSGKKALAVLDSKEWDLVISDVMMPQMSGYELSRTIRRQFTITELPILLLTARSQPEDIENGFLSGANDYVTKPVDALEIRARVRTLTEVKQSVREQLRMEAAWLQAQIQPHFLFNTLNTVYALSEIDMDRMRNLLEAFSNFLRDKFKFQSADELVPIEEELSIVRSYLYIEKERFDDRLQVTWEISGCKQLKIPLLTIQPLVENAVRHGIMKRARGGNIHIRLSDYETYAKIVVADDGVGMDEEMVQRIFMKQSDTTSGIGLSNTDRRLKRHFGRGLQITSKPGYGTSISFIVYKNK
ncbi:ATP-binding protein [Aneurinibacillus aneurinilyticus]|nr:ATP-binding protein [Aneurinibacillus aneurinilyticus]MED0705101.1 ATP-binding protein [Aneurinibacillus aneurinilyticus]MED0724256.1 ATP-binding protein [Aneurinibacillus aneurinilyticus]MED0733013.1 ATP-binding protein [Aneurinibacillus aneurinilyticus]MED0743900.1 ATP-binding protein [Aneurinibacillus aneurinilyticus]